MRVSGQRAFTLIEMAFVLLILGLLTRLAVGPLAALSEHGKRSQARQELQDIRSTVFAYLVSYGSLPCPMSVSIQLPAAPDDQNLISTQGDNDPVCSTAHGWVSANEFRLQGRVNPVGALIDPWGREYRYSVSLENNAEFGNTALPDWTTPGEASLVGVTGLSSELTLCNSLSGSGCSGLRVRSDQIAFVVSSTGADDSAGGLQHENQDDDNYFLVSDESVVPGSEFDDLIVWGATADVIYHWLQIGWLP